MPTVVSGSRHHRPTWVILTLALALAPASAAAPGRWDLAPLYPNDAAWEQARQELAADLDALEPYRGKLGDSAETLRRALDALFELRLASGRLHVYAQLRGDEDLREAGPQGMQQTLTSTLADLDAATAWLDPEILAIPQDTLDRFLAAEPGLAVYRRYLERLEQKRPHVLDPDAERLLGMSQRIRDEGQTIAGLLRNADIPWPTITLSDGTELRVDAQGYNRGRVSAERRDRIATYDAFYSELKQFEGSLAAALAATVQEHVFVARARSYASSLEASLAPNEVPVAVYHMLIDEIHEALPVLHRYLRLRARMLGIDDLRYHDMYPPLVADVDAVYDWDSAKKLVARSLAPLGADYVQRFERALDSGWVDVHPRPGKRSGAYVEDSAYEVHPYMLLNHLDDYNGASTLAHEAGHLMHSALSQEAQPYPTSNYSIFVAEVASTVNEVLMFRDLLGRAADDDERLALLGNFLERLRTTVFRQVMFAEFELGIHEAAERGEPLTADTMADLYGSLLRRYHGADSGVMEIDEPYHVEWASVPHFHYDFYVYQYATSFVAATALAEGIEADKPGARPSYLAFLKAGGSQPPVELLKKAGVDMTGPEPIRAAMRLMNDVLDRIETILDRRGGGAKPKPRG
jgi:oligoendopeptidase F